MSNLNGKVAVITGATGGIGFEVAKRLGKDGYTVVLNGIESEAGAKRVEELTSSGIPAEYYDFDVTNDEAVSTNIKAIGEKYGRIDVLVNNAGINMKKPVADVTNEDFQKIINVNLYYKNNKTMLST